ncbi:hypothetical protein ACTFIW_011026 [Dictyostelium discoideum]
MSTNKKIKTDNNNKIFQDIIDYEILRSIINYLLISKKNKNNNNNNNSNNNNNNQYKINRFYFYINEILNYTLVSKKWYNFISLTISNNIINNKLFEYWLKINYNIIGKRSFTEVYNNQNQYNKNNLIFNNRKKISFNKEFSIIKIKESIIDDYFKFNLFFNRITINDLKEIKNKFENNQLLYNRIVVSFGSDLYASSDDIDLSEIQEYVSNENPEIMTNLFKILELNCNIWLDHEGYSPNSEEEEEEEEEENKKCSEIYLNHILVTGFDRETIEDEETVKIFKILKGKNLVYDASDIEVESLPHVNYSALFDPDNSGQQVESIKVNVLLEPEYEEFVEARHLIKVNQFKNLHSISIPINPYQILSNFSEEMGLNTLYDNRAIQSNSKNMKSELNQMINSLITSKSLKNLKLTSCVSSVRFRPNDYYDGNDDGDHEIFVNNINQTIESYSNCFQPLFSELNTSIERIELDCMGLLNINTFSNLLNNKSIKYLYLYGDSDFIVYSSKLTGDNGSDNGGDGGGDYELHKEPISINQYLFDNIFTSPLTSIRHYRINIKELKQLKFIFNLILNNIFKLQLYSLIFELHGNRFVGEFVKEFKNLINNISIQQQEQQQKSNNITLKEIKIKIERYKYKYIQELNNINNPYFTTIIEN